MNIVTKALEFATLKHAGQLRKYTYEPYIVHPIEVAELVRWAGGSDEDIATALLHDTVEDTDATNEDIVAMFGVGIAIKVWFLTDGIPMSAGSRKVRKKLEADRMVNAPAGVANVKVADFISNTKSIAKYDRGFARVYLLEKEYALTKLTHADSRLWALAKNLLLDGKERVGLAS